MNYHCLKCECIYMMALVRATNAWPRFGCSESGESRPFLNLGDKLECFRGEDEPVSTEEDVESRSGN